DNGDCADGCNYTDNAIAAGIDGAVSAGAKVINISLGGSSANIMLRNAFARASSSGTVIVVSAGNDGKGEVDPLAVA
ncbi:S8 family serine peptidase, partial [Klebsiella pneumoniae]|nr:S8 family serine peptidase [Klebsiella pneumoniae]